MKMPAKGKSVVYLHIEMEGKVYSFGIGVNRCWAVEIYVKME
jgi:hypothetical protein